jgi:hypothetical protein
MLPCNQGVAMPKLARFIGAVAAGLLVWAIVATLCNFILRAAIPGYRAEEVAVSFSLNAQLARLGLAVISTAAAAVVTTVLSREGAGGALAVGCILLALFVPAHISLWHRFPVWYHVFFLVSLPLVAYVVGRLVADRNHPAPGADA